MTARCSASPPPWIELPRDVTANILRRLDPEEMLNTAERVCTTWRSVCGDPSLWRVFDLKLPAKLHTRESRNHAGSVCRRAVDRSQGGLIDIRIMYFGTDGLLRYISERLRHLNTLTLESCDYISGKALATSVKSFPHLEELHLFFVTTISAMDIEAIGVSCPKLKSFTFYSYKFMLRQHNKGLDRKRIDDSDALSIAKSMPNLVRLSLCGNLLGNEGLLAVLDGCLKLESLDLGRCFGVDLESDVGRRCMEEIKELRRPMDGRDDRFYDPVFGRYRINLFGPPSKS